MAGLALAQRREIASWLLLGEIHRAGIVEASLVVESVGVERLAIRELRLGAPPDLEIARVEARYSPASLLSGRLEELSATGLRLRASLRDDGLSLGALDALVQGEASGAAVLPARNIAVSDARAELETTDAVAAIPFRVEVHDIGDGKLQGEGSFEVEHPLASASGLVSIEGAPDDFQATLRGTIDLPDLELSLAGIEATAHLEDSRGEGNLRIGALRDLQRPARVVPLALHGSFEIRDAGVDYRLKLAEAGENLVLEAWGSADPAAGSARAQLHLHPIVWEQGGLQPAALFPLLGGLVDQARGSVEAVGNAVWDGVRVTGQIDLALRDLGLTAAGAEISEVNGRIVIRGPTPLVTPPGQLISVARVDLGLELTDGLIDFQLRPDGLLELKTVELHWGGGVVRTAGALDPTADSQQLVLEVEDVDLGELLAMVDLEGLEGNGSLAGQIPIFRKGETVEIRRGELHGGPEGGRIRYRPGAAAGALAGQGYGIEQLLGALDDFHYDSLRLTVDGDTRGEAVVAIRLGGSNPNYQGGRRVEFNLNVEAHLADLLRAGMASYRVPEVIERKLEQFQVPEVQ